MPKKEEKLNKHIAVTDRIHKRISLYAKAKRLFCHEVVEKGIDALEAQKQRSEK
jgi:hypothetical protein